MKQRVLATSLALAFAGFTGTVMADYFTNINITSGYAKVSGYASGDDKAYIPGPMGQKGFYTYQLLLRDLNGSVSIQTPQNMYSPYTVYAKGSVTADISNLNLTPIGGPDLSGSPDISINIPNWTQVYSGSFTHTGLTLPVYNFNFTPGTLGVSDPYLISPTIAFAFEYDGNTTPAVLAVINSLLTPFGLPGFSNTDGSGKMAISGTIYQDGALLNITESDLTWTGFGGLMKALDLPIFAPANEQDATFTANMQLRFVPEPATLGLLGLGLLGLAAARRRRAA